MRVYVLIVLLLSINVQATNLVPIIQYVLLDSDTVAPPERQIGFSSITPSIDSQIIYVSNRDGSDQNNCLSVGRPCKTIAAGLDKMRPGFPDHVYLKRGDVWRGESLRAAENGRSATEPAVIAFYGPTGKRPRLELDGDFYRNVRRSISNFHIIGLEFAGYKHDPDHAEFTGASSDGASLFFLGGADNILVEDCLFNYAELLFQPWDTGHATNIKVRRNIFMGSYYNESSFNRNRRPSNMFVSGVDGILIEQNVFDYGGWNPRVVGAGANAFNHNVYIQYTTVGNGVVFRQNIVARGSSHGVHGRPGGLYEENFFARNTVSLQLGYPGQPLALGSFAIGRANVITEGESMVKGDQACTGAGLCTPALWGINIDELGEGRFQVEDNIVHSLSDNEQWRDIYSSLSERAIRNLNGVTYNNNHSWHWDTPSQGDAENYPDPGRTAADYNAFLGGQRSLDGFMDQVKKRPLQTWDERYSAKSINDYIRQGYE